MSRNYGAGTRDMAQAGRIILASAVAHRECSFATMDVVADRWRLFARYAKAHGVGRMERVTVELVRRYGQDLAERVHNDELSPAYVQNLVSAANTVMGLTRRWAAVSPTRDCGIPHRSTIRKAPPAGLDSARFDAAMRDLQSSGLMRQAAVAGIAKALGLRSKEASLLNARVALLQAETQEHVLVVDGTKGGRPRQVPILCDEQVEALTYAMTVQADDRSMIPAEISWAQWRHGGLRDGREVLQCHGIMGYHDLRAAYACARYEALTGQPAPVCRVPSGSVEVDDLAARQTISRELGHDRVAVVAAYIGSH